MLPLNYSNNTVEFLLRQPTEMGEIGNQGVKFNEYHRNTIGRADTCFWVENCRDCIDVVFFPSSKNSLSIWNWRSKSYLKCGTKHKLGRDNCESWRQMFAVLLLFEIILNNVFSPALIAIVPDPLRKEKKEVILPTPCTHKLFLAQDSSYVAPLVDFTGDKGVVIP